MIPRRLEEAVGLVEMAAPLDPMDVIDFDKIVSNLGTMLKRASRHTQQSFLERLAVLVGVPPSQPEQIQGFVRRIREEILGMAAPTAEATKITISSQTQLVYARTKKALRSRFRLGAVAVGFGLADREAVQFLRRQHVFFMRNSFGALAKQGSEQARKITAKGLKEGLGQKEIARELEERILNRLKMRGYMETLASLFAGRSRTYSQMVSYDSVRVERYMIVAVLDERTTEQCRFLHGKTFSVGDSLGKLQALQDLPDPEDVRFAMPFLRQWTGPEDRKLLGILGEDGKRVVVAEVLGAAEGLVDQVGKYDQRRSDEDIQDLGIGPPPYHFRCVAERSPILTRRGWVVVEHLRVGDEVFTHRGRWRRISGLASRRHNGGLVRLVNLISSVILTDDHPVLTPRGYCPAGDLRAGKEVFCHGRAKGVWKSRRHGSSDLSNLLQGIPGFPVSRNEVLFQKVSAARPGGSNAEEESGEGGERPFLSSEDPSHSDGLLPYLWSRFSDGEGREKVLFPALQTTGAAGHVVDRTLSDLRKVGSPQRGAEADGDCNLLLDDLSEQSPEGAGETGEFPAEDVRKEEPDVWEASCSSVSHRISGAAPTEFLRTSVLRGNGRGRDSVRVRTPAIPDGRQNVPPRFLSPGSRLVDRGQGVGPEEARVFDEGVPEGVRPDSPLSEAVSGVFRVLPLLRADRFFSPGTRVYTLQVEEDETFVVGGGILTHNCRTDTIPL